ncbi:hypothetical protein PLICRDRAFT_279557 [Plicaturopsis crispa FD-325 SS-3]|nr:hypothetical protein PLICRDRAFT_279557 [Plicaturopsis crispa FD-325 SS-3]
MIPPTGIMHTLDAPQSHANSDSEHAPISHCPDEILAEIFSYGDPLYSPWMLPSSVIVSHVSRRWRHIALSYSVLWTRIWNRSGHVQSEEEFSYPLDLLDLHLELSRPRLLDIRCNIDSAEFFERILANVDRLSSLTIRAYIDEEYYGHDDEFDPRPFFRQFTPLHAPNLRHLDINMGRHTRSRRISIFKGGCPLLSSLNFAGDTFSVCRLPASTFESITVLNLSRGCTDDEEGSIGTAQKVVARMLSLKELIIDIARFNFWDARAAVTVPSLETLDIRGIRQRHDLYTRLVLVCTCIMTPALKCLKFRNACPEELDRFAMWLKTQLDNGRDPFPRIRALHLHGAEPTPALVRVFPSITHAVVAVQTATFHLSSLTASLERLPGETRAPWPCLRSLVLKSYHPTEEDRLSDLVAARIAAECPLQRLVVRWDRHTANFGELSDRASEHTSLTG